MEKPLHQLFAEMPWGDLWPDAKLVEVVRYLRGSTKLAIPAGWRELIPAEL